MIRCAISLICERLHLTGLTGQAHHAPARRYRRRRHVGHFLMENSWHDKEKPVNAQGSLRGHNRIDGYARHAPATQRARDATRLASSQIAPKCYSFPISHSPYATRFLTSSGLPGRDADDGQPSPGTRDLRRTARISQVRGRGGPPGRARPAGNGNNSASWPYRCSSSLRSIGMPSARWTAPAHAVSMSAPGGTPTAAGDALSETPVWTRSGAVRFKRPGRPERLSVCPDTSINTVTSINTMPWQSRSAHGPTLWARRL